ncbi:MAG: hypothetical protein WCI27_01730 [Candidatus Omnitrophota bacterium]
MAEAKFSYKEAIGHGWEMTRKYWVSIALVLFCLVCLQVGSGVLQKFAGQSFMFRHEVAAEFKDRGVADQMYEYLQKAGYVDQRGRVQAKLQDMITADDLSLTPDLETKRIQLYNFLNQYRYKFPFPKIMYYVLQLVVILLMMFLSIVVTRFWLAVSRDQTPAVSDLFANVGVLLPIIASSLCYGLMLVVGLILLIVPGFIAMIMFGMYKYLILDKGLGPIAALKRSREITRGQKGRLFVFGLLIVLLNCAGFLCLLVGLLVTMPISAIAGAYIYDRLENGPLETVPEELSLPAPAAV